MVDEQQIANALYEMAHIQLARVAKRLAEYHTPEDLRQFLVYLAMLLEVDLIGAPDEIRQWHEFMRTQMRIALRMEDEYAVLRSALAD